MVEHSNNNHTDNAYNDDDSTQDLPSPAHTLQFKISPSLTQSTAILNSFDIELHYASLPENLKLNIARSVEESKEQSKSRKAIITTEITGGDIRSERAQKDAKRFDKKDNQKNMKNENEEKLKISKSLNNKQTEEQKDVIN